MLARIGRRLRIEDSGLKTGLDDGRLEDWLDWRIEDWRIEVRWDLRFGDRRIDRDNLARSTL